MRRRSARQVAFLLVIIFFGLNGIEGEQLKVHGVLRQFVSESVHKYQMHLEYPSGAAAFDQPQSLGYVQCQAFGGQVVWGSHGGEMAGVFGHFRYGAMACIARASAVPEGEERTGITRVLISGGFCSGLRLVEKYACLKG